MECLVHTNHHFKLLKLLLRLLINFIYFYILFFMVGCILGHYLWELELEIKKDLIGTMIMKRSEVSCTQLDFTNTMICFLKKDSWFISRNFSMLYYFGISKLSRFLFNSHGTDLKTLYILCLFWIFMRCIFK